MSPTSATGRPRANLAKPHARVLSAAQQRGLHTRDQILLELQDATRILDLAHHGQKGYAMHTYAKDFTEPITICHQDTEPIFALLADYRDQLTSHPFLVAARKLELSQEILLELAFHQYSDSILWIPMLAQMKAGATRSRRLRIAIEDNIAHEAGLGSTSHVTLAAAMMRSLGVRRLEPFPTSTFAHSAELWLSDAFATQSEPELAGWLLTAETLVPHLFAAVLPCYVGRGETRYFEEHVAVDSDEHARWMADSVRDVVTIYGPSCVPEVLRGMADAWEETREVPDTLWSKQCASR